MPSKKAAKTVRAKRVALKAALGQPVTAIARSEGVVDRTVRRDLQSTDAKAFLGRLLDQHSEELRELYARSLRSIREAQDAVLYAQAKSGDSSELAETAFPDHGTRLEAAKRLESLLAVQLRSHDPSAGRDGAIPWPQIEILLQQFNITTT